MIKGPEANKVLSLEGDQMKRKAEWYQSARSETHSGNKANCAN